MAYKIFVVAGARPNFMKVAPLMKAFSKHSEFEAKLVHTGQHFDAKMSDAFFQDLDIPQPDISLGINTGSQAEQTANILMKFDLQLEKEKPNLVVVVGDVNSTVACSLAASKREIPIAHVEAGLRSFNRGMPEELNRIVTDHLSNYLFTTEKAGNENLKNEGILDGVFLVGNVMIDCLVQHQSKINQSQILGQLNLKPKKYLLATFHRPSNVDEKQNLQKVIEILNASAEFQDVVFPVHPRTRNNLKNFNLQDSISKNVRLIDPAGYLDFVSLEKNARAVLTDSGGIQEETTFLGIPCITAREETERPSTVEVGTNVVTGLNSEKILQNLELIQNQKFKKGKIPEFWDGKTAERIAKTLLEFECNACFPETITNL